MDAAFDHTHPHKPYGRFVKQHMLHALSSDLADSLSKQALRSIHFMSLRTNILSNVLIFRKIRLLGS